MPSVKMAQLHVEILSKRKSGANSHFHSPAETGNPPFDCKMKEKN